MHRKNEPSYKYIFKAYNQWGTSNTNCFHSKERTLTCSRDSIDNIMFSLHLALNTWRDKGMQSFLTNPHIEQKMVV